MNKSEGPVMEKEELSLVSLNDDTLMILMGQHCEVRSVAALSMTCRRFSQLLRPKSVVWKAHLFRELSIDDEPNVQLLDDARALLKNALQKPRMPKTLNADSEAIRSESIVITEEEVGGDAKVVYASFKGGNLMSVRADTPFSLSEEGFRKFFNIRTIIRAKDQRRGSKKKESPPQRTVMLSEVAYFEVQLQQPNACSNDAKRNVVLQRPNFLVGLSTEKFPLVGRCVGERDDSFGYSEDGWLFYPEGSPQKIFPPFGEGDVVGCGLHLPTGAIFFTLNGKFVATAACLNYYDDSLYATVGCYGTGTGTVKVNFGQFEPFLFDPEQATALYGSMSSDEKLFDTPPQLPKDFTCTFPQVSMHHPWSTRAGRPRMINLCTPEETGWYPGLDQDYSDY